MLEGQKSVSLINKKITEGRAVVMSDTELVNEIMAGRKLTVADIDVVTISWNTRMTGTAIMLCVPITERGIFTRAQKIWLNGVSGWPGPAPNERLGVVDALVFAEYKSRDKGSDYTGAMLIENLLRGDEINVECLSEEGDIYRNKFTLSQLQFAKMYVYNCFLEGYPTDIVDSDYGPNIHMSGFAAGSKILLNRAVGVIVGSGTQSSSERKSLSIAAELFDMDPDEVMSHIENGRVEGTNSVAAALAVLSEEDLRVVSAWATKVSSDKLFRMSQPDDKDNDTSQYLKELVIKGAFLLCDCSETTSTSHTECE